MYALYAVVDDNISVLFNLENISFSLFILQLNEQS
jgi:hypothetical protein